MSLFNRALRPPPTLSDQAIYEPLGMSATSSRFSDFQAAPNHASGHVLVDGGYQAKYVRDPDAQTPAGGVSASVTDVRAPIHFSAVNKVAEAASRAPSPSMESVIAVKSPSATPTAIGSAVRQPWPSA